MQEFIKYNGHDVQITDVTITESYGYLDTRINIDGWIIAKPESAPKLTKEETINKVIFNFDFEQVMKVMSLLNWKWVSDTESGIPSVGELVICSQKLLNEAYEGVLKSEKTFFAVTGGFKATATKYEDGEILLELDFIISNFNYSNMDTCY